MSRPVRLAATLLAALGIATAAGCGVKGDRDQVRDTVTAFRDATAKKDYDRICKHVLAPVLVSRLGRLGVPCELALSKYLAPTSKPTLDVAKVEIHGTSAKAYVSTSAKGQAPSRDIVSLVKTKDGWRIASLSAPAGS